jgi:2-polyprenyl-3-methyl-5-hydroxy-6-metoxy-1,4-benzoquinol methylase
MSKPSPPTLLLTTPERCPVCNDSRHRSLGPIRYGVNALVADQDATELAQKLGRVELVKCAACGFGWTDPGYTMDAVHELYRQNQTTHWEGQGRDWSRHHAYLRPYLSEGGKALDIGCYTGDFLAKLGPDWERWGIEPIPFAAERARAQGVQIIESTLEETQFSPGSFDLITLWDVAEHLPHPREAFSRIIEWLKPGGVLALETGNASCAFARYMGPDWWYVALLEHCSFHTPESFSKLFGSLGLRVESCRNTRHHDMGRLRTVLQLGKAALYRTVSRASEAGAGWSRLGPLPRLLRKHAPCALVTDHLFLIARRPERPASEAAAS